MKKAIGLDISKYDRIFKPEDSIYPIDFVVVRAGHSYAGTFYEDPRFVDYLPAVSKIPVRLSYCYLNSATTLELQVEEFIDTVNKADFEWHGFVCDWEGSYNTLSESFADKGLRWMQEIEDRTGIKPILYTNRSLYEQYWLSRGKNYDLWISWPLSDGTWNLENIHNKVPSMPDGRTDWLMWQFSYTIKGTDWGLGRPGSGDIDMFNGSVEELHKRFLEDDDNDTPEIPMDKTLVDTTQLVKVDTDKKDVRKTLSEFRAAMALFEDSVEKLNASVDTLIRTSQTPEEPEEPEHILYKSLYNLNIRSAPAIADNKVGSMLSGNTFEVFETTEKTNGNIWGRMAEGWVALKYNGIEFCTRVE